MKYSFPLLIIILIISIGFIFYWGIYLPKEANSAQTVAFFIKKGEGAKEISINLEKQGLVKWHIFFRFYVLIKGVAGDLKAGEYLLSKSMNIPEIVDKFVLGKVIKKKLTIIEGWNLGEIASYLEDNGISKPEELFKLDREERNNSLFSNEFDFLKDKPKNMGLEGYLFPDTYEISHEAEVDEIVRKMLVNFGKKLNRELRKEIEIQGKTIFEIITMASLLEKEVKTFKDKKIVSGILWKRLENNIPLQVDATISYITGKKTTKVSIEETQLDSPYNTYRYQGLPLGPIANPGLESIKAAIYPEPSEYFYYLSTPQGETVFSRTLKEHNIAKSKYLK